MVNAVIVVAITTPTPFSHDHDGKLQQRMWSSESGICQFLNEMLVSRVNKLGWSEAEAKDHCIV